MKYFLLISIFAFSHTCLSQVGRELSNDSLFLKNFLLIDSLEMALTNADERQAMQIHFELFREYFSVNYQKAVVNLDKSLQKAFQLGDSLGIVKALLGRGFVLKDKGEVQESIKVLGYALGIAKRHSFNDQTKYLLNNLAMTHASLASYDKALKYNFESLKIREEEGDPASISIALNNIGFTYYELGDYENALLYYQKGYKFKLENKVLHDLDRSLINIGTAFIDLKMFEQAETKIKEVLARCDSVKCRPDILMEAYHAFGKILFNQNKMIMSEMYFRRSLELSGSPMTVYNFFNQEFKSSNLYWLALIKRKQGNIEDAIKHLNASQDLAKKAGFQKIILENYGLFVEIYSSKKDYENAFYFQSRFNKLNAEILNANLISKISQIQSDFNERENTIKLATQSKIMELQLGSIHRQKLLNLTITAIAALTLGLATVLFMTNRQKQRINEVLDNKVRERTAELEKNRDKLKRAHDAQAIILRKIKDELISSLATMKGLSYLATKELPGEQSIYFREAEITTKKMVDFVVKYSVPD